MNGSINPISDRRILFPPCFNSILMWNWPLIFHSHLCICSSKPVDSCGSWSICSLFFHVWGNSPTSTTRSRAPVRTGELEELPGLHRSLGTNWGLWVDDLSVTDPTPRSSKAKDWSSPCRSHYKYLCFQIDLVQLQLFWGSIYWDFNVFRGIQKNLRARTGCYQKRALMATGPFLRDSCVILLWSQADCALP